MSEQQRAWFRQAAAESVELQRAAVAPGRGRRARLGPRRGRQTSIEVDKEPFRAAVAPIYDEMAGTPLGALADRIRRVQTPVTAADTSSLMRTDSPARTALRLAALDRVARRRADRPHRRDGAHRHVAGRRRASLLNSPSSYTEELATYLLLWISLLGAAYALRQRAHLGIDMVVTARLRAGGPAAARVVSYVVVALFALVALVIGGGILVSVTLRTGPALGRVPGARRLRLPRAPALVAC